MAPTLATLRRWRKSVPPHFAFAVVLGPHASRVRPGPALDQEVDAARRAAEALQARCIVLRTPPEVTPAAVWRERVARVIAKIPRDVTHFVWEPAGLWEPEDAAAQARAWNVVLAVDPVREHVPPGPIAYLRVRALGETRSLGPVALERIAAAGAGAREVFAILETDSAAVEAKRLRTLARGVPPAQGPSRLVRPRAGGIVVRDDEQE
jgi:uncharacterized protein YecE (DUF72 family)